MNVHTYELWFPWLVPSGGDVPIGDKEGEGRVVDGLCVVARRLAHITGFGVWRWGRTD